jgi:integrase
MDNRDKTIFLSRLEDDIEINVAYDAVIGHRKLFKGSTLTELQLAPKTIKVEDNLYLYHNSGSPYFWCRFRAPGIKKEIRKSTENKTLNGAKAESKLIKYKITEQVKAGTYYQEDAITWRKVCTGAINELQAKADKAKKDGAKRSSTQDYIPIIRDYYLTIDEWRDIDIKLFKNIQLRKLKDLNNFQYMPKTTATKRKTALKEIFEFAQAQGYVETIPDLPKFDFIESETGDPFQVNDLRIIMSNFISFLESSKNNYITRHKRTILPLYVNFLILTGVRPGEEAIGIQWKHITKHKGNKDEKEYIYYVLEIIKGKRSKAVKRDGKVAITSRDLIIGPDALETLEQLHYVLTTEKKSIDSIRKEKPNDNIFIGNTEADIDFGSAWTQYETYLKRFKKLKKHYTLYSCRHEYINKCIEDGKSKELIAKQCGTSVKTIEAHYEKFRPENTFFRILSKDELARLNPTPEEKST